MRDYELLRKELPGDNEVAESLHNAQVALKKSRGVDVLHMKISGEVEEISSLERFKTAISTPGEIDMLLCGFHFLKSGI